MVNVLWIILSSKIGKFQNFLISLDEVDRTYNSLYEFVVDHEATFISKAAEGGMHVLKHLFIELILRRRKKDAYSYEC